MDEVEHLLSVIPGIVKRLRDMSPLYASFKQQQKEHDK